jgi:transposase
MTQDGRKLDRATQAHVRRQVVLAVRKGMRQVEAAKVFGMSLRFVQKACAKARDGGLRSLNADHRGRPSGAGRLDGVQQARIYRLITGKMPDQLRLSFYLWTRQAVGALVRREYGIELSLTTVGRYLKAWGMTAQKPVRRAYERNDEAIAQWCSQTYPLLARQAKREGAQIYWGDEMGLRSDHVAGTSFAPAGQTPVVRATGQRFGCNMVSAITNRGALAFMVFAGKFTNAVFIEFLKRLLKHSDTKLVLIVDGHPVHRSVAVREFVAGNAERLRLVVMPGYCPELNPDELLNQDVKTNALGKSRPANKAELVGTVRAHLHRRQKQPHVVRNLFREKHVRYAA